MTIDPINFETVYSWHILGWLYMSAATFATTFGIFFSTSSKDLKQRIKEAITSSSFCVLLFATIYSFILLPPAVRMSYNNFKIKELEMQHKITVNRCIDAITNLIED